MLDINLIKKAYKKLKCSVYFDKTQLVLRDMLVKFEKDEALINKKLENLFEQLIDDEKWNSLSEKLLNKIDFLAFPKKLVKTHTSEFISNIVSDTVNINELQYFIKMDVRGHILGVLWLLLVGWKYDEETYEHSYGNRLRKNMLDEIKNNEDISFSPYLFEPYFQQYESWRDNGLEYAQKGLDKNQDILILTMDFKRFYYSVDIKEEMFDNLIEDKEKDSQEDRIKKRLCKFVYNVIVEYSKKVPENKEGRNILPIGFLPSNVLANRCLYNFDKAIVDGWNPLYYGRYVDDVIIIEKIEKNSDIYSKARRGELKQDEILHYYLNQCSKWRGFVFETNCNELHALFQKAPDKEYILNKKYNPIKNDGSCITIKNDKVKVFYFKYDESDALINCFRKHISKNKSEFRFLPEDVAVFQEDDYSEIIDLKMNDTINKFRGISSVSIDKFALSKYLGKFMRIGSMVNDKIETKFERDIIKIFDAFTIIENYTTWEKVVEIFVINGKFDTLYKYIEKIMNSIENVNISDEYVEEVDKSALVKVVKESLVYTLQASINRILALFWGKSIGEFVDKWVTLRNKKVIRHISYEQICKMREYYLNTRMCDKYVMPLIVDACIQIYSEYNDEKEIELTNFSCILKELEENIEELGDILLGDYGYHPYMITMYDLYSIEMINIMMKYYLERDIDKNTSIKNLEEIAKNYVKINYSTETDIMTKLISMSKIEHGNHFICIGDEKKSKLKIAIANTKLNHKNFEMAIKSKPNRSFKRYESLSKIINQSIKEDVDMLILPEACVPFEWLSTIARTCAKNQIALITGVEHIIFGKKVFNFTSIILPYKEGTHPSAAIIMHLKNHYAPSEKQQIEGYRMQSVEGKGYELYCWNDCWFPVYCCYELASIKDRSLFQSYADLLIAVEWNPDVNYYSNIMESLSRDLHCYCVQVNSADYGDSRITLPAKTESRDIIKTKGGINDTILIGSIDIEDLRDFQLKEYSLQKRSGAFKPTPPLFDKDIVEKKIKGILKQYIIESYKIN